MGGAPQTPRPGRSRWGHAGHFRAILPRVKISKEWDAAAYQTLSEPQFAWGQKVLAKVDLRGDEAALDIGCGTGRLTAELLARLPRGRVVALDQSHNMIAEAAKNLSQSLGDRVSFRAGDVLSLDDHEAYDLVFSTATFHWVLDHDALFRVIHRALRPGGRLVAQCGGQGNLARTRDLALALAGKAPYAPHFPPSPDHWLYASAEDTASRLRAAGFVDIQTNIEDTPTPFPSPEIFRAFVERIVLRGFVARLPDEALRERFLDEIVNDAGAADPPYTLGYKRLNIVARRAAQ